MKTNDAVSWAQENLPHQWQALQFTFRRLGGLASECQVLGEKQSPHSFFTILGISRFDQRRESKEADYIRCERLAVEQVEPIIKAWSNVCFSKKDECPYERTAKGASEIMASLEEEFQQGQKRHVNCSR